MSVIVRPYRRGGWEVDIVVTLPNGDVQRERKKSPVSSKSASLRWGQERERLLLIDGLKKKKSKEVPTLSEFKPRYMEGYARANREKPSGVEAKESVFRAHLLPLFGSKKLNDIHDEDVQRLKGRLITRSPKTVNNVLTVLNTCLKIAVRWGVIDAMPAKIELVKVPPTTMTFYDFDEYGALVEAAGLVDARCRAMVLLGGDAGLRRGEMMALEWSDINVRLGFITVQRSEWRGKTTVPKGGRPRRVPMTSRLKAALQAIKHLREARVFYRDGGPTPTNKMMRNWMRSAQRRANLAVDGRIHVLRHTFCSHLAMRGAPTRAIQELAGHAHLSTTQRYMHLSPAALESAIRLLEQTASMFGDGLETPPGERRRPQ